MTHALRNRFRQTRISPRSNRSSHSDRARSHARCSCTSCRHAATLPVRNACMNGAYGKSYCCSSAGFGRYPSSRLTGTSRIRIALLVSCTIHRKLLSKVGAHGRQEGRMEVKVGRGGRTSAAAMRSPDTSPTPCRATTSRCAFRGARRRAVHASSTSPRRLSVE